MLRPSGSGNIVLDCRRAAAVSACLTQAGEGAKVHDDLRGEQRQPKPLAARSFGRDGEALTKRGGKKRTPAPPPRTAAIPAGAPGRARLIRRVRRGDLEAIIALDTRTTGLSKDSHWRELVERGGRSRRENEFVFLVAVSDDASASLSGFIVGEVRAWEFGSAPCGWVYAMAVEPALREQHVGEHLLAAVATEFRRAGVKKMRTMVAKDNRLPMLFFRGEGMMAGPYIQLEKDLE